MNFKRFIGIGVLAGLCVLTLCVGKSHSDQYRGVSESRHDLSITGTSPFTYDTAIGEHVNEQVCIFCHTPHGATVPNLTKATHLINGSGYLVANASAGPKGFLLWNRNLPTLGTPNFTAYQSSTLNVSIGSVRTYSLLCMSCHDGVGAMNVLINYPGDSNQPLEGIMGAPNTMGEIFNSSLPGGWGPNIGDRVNTSGPMNLSNDHPVSFDINATLITQDGGLNATIDTTVGYFGRTELKLWPNPATYVKSSVECSTCHDVHNQGGTGSDPLYPFLRVSKVNSELCTSCHNK